MRHLLACLICLCLGIGAAHADPMTYELEGDRSDVGVEVDFGPDQIFDSFPALSADILIDFTVPSRSTVAMVLDISGARALSLCRAGAARAARPGCPASPAGAL